MPPAEKPPSPDDVNRMISAGDLPVAAYVSSLPAIIIFLLLAILTSAIARRDWNLQHWPQTTGTVSLSFVTRDCRTTAPSGTRAGARGRSAAAWDKSCPRVFVPHLRYGYEVDGKRYVGENIAYWGPRFETQAEADAWQSKTKPGTRIDVFYDPGDPSSAVTDKRWSPSGMVFAGVFWLAFLGSVALRRARKP